MDNSLAQPRQEDVVEGNMETPLIPPTRYDPVPPVNATAISNQLPSLSKPLLLLYGFNGITLAFPMLALTYIVNTRVAMPLSDLSIYGALAFCPFSLKPLYAYLSSSKYHRHIWITSLLLLNGISTAATAFIPNATNSDLHSNAIMLCFLLALIRGITCAWPEFLLGSTLIDQATIAVAQGHPTTLSEPRPSNDSSSYGLEQIVARFQSQAATARNLGSLLAHVGVILILFLHQKLRSKQDLNDGLVNTMLVVTGAWNVVGAIVAGVCRVGYPQRLEQPNVPESNEESNVCDQEDYVITDHSNNHWTENSMLVQNGNGQDNNQLVEEEQSGFSRCCKDRSQSGGDAVFIVALQVSLILLIVRAPLSHWLQPHPNSHGGHASTLNVLVIVGVVLVTLCSTVVITALYCLGESSNQQEKLRLQRYRVGIFLVLRHAMPSCSAVMSSFFYSMFQATPWVLQLLSLTDMATITMASWSYGRWLAPLSHGWSVLLIIAGTTVLSSLAEILFLVVTPSSGIHNSLVQTVVVILVKAAVTFSGEWQFLPDVVLATSSAAANAEAEDNRSSNSRAERSTGITLVETDQLVHLRRDSSTEIGARDRYVPNERRDESTSSNQPQLWYGTLISCIDFGGQIGSWMTVPLVAALDITRENNWAHLHVLVGLSSVLGIVTLFFLVLLQPDTKMSRSSS